MQALKKLSRKSIIWGFINLFILFPFFIYCLGVVSYISQNKENDLLYYILDISLTEPVIILLGLLIINLIIDFIVYQDASKNILKRIIIIFNMLYFIIIYNYFYQTYLIVNIAITVYLLFKLKAYYDYFKLCNKLSTNSKAVNNN